MNDNEQIESSNNINYDSGWNIIPEKEIWKFRLTLLWIIWYDNDPENLVTFMSEIRSANNEDYSNKRLSS